MATTELNFFDYVKAAFHQKGNIPGLGLMPVNKMMLTAAVILGFWNPGFWFLGIAGEALYLWLMASNKNYQNVVQGTRLNRQKEAWGEKQLQLLQSLDGPSRERYQRLAENCYSILKITGSNWQDQESASKDLRVSGLNKLLWMFTKLLSSRLRIEAIISRTSPEELEKEIQQISRKMETQPESSPLRRSLQGTLDIQKRRLENLLKAMESLEVVKVELDRIEKQAALLKEEASVSSDPELVSIRLDGVMDSLSGTSQWMSEQDELFGSMEESSMPDQLLYRPGKEKQMG
ncbi:MAG: hypothetical protein MUF15_12360 [Acidobacteria bacterium]|jgi:hypothetical protein|nr:hypothetical protein [Acidobacteriota bacterium]